MDGLAAAQIAVAFVLLAAAGLFIHSFFCLQRSNPGFNPTRLMAVELNRPDRTGQQPDQRRAAFCREVLERVESLPGVLGAATVSHLPFGGNQLTQGFQIEGRETPGLRLSAEKRCVSISYFGTAGIPLLKGRSFSRADQGDNRVMVVDETFVRRYFPNEDPLGRRIRQRGEWHEIVGVVGSIKLQSLNEPSLRPHMYVPITQECPAEIALVARTAGQPVQLTTALRQAIRDVDPTQPILRIESVKCLVHESIGSERLSATLLGGLSAVALVLSALGIYGVLAFAVSQRNREMAIRMALGAQRAEVIRTIMRKGIRLTFVGLVAGFAGSLILGRSLASLLYGIDAADPATYAAVVAILATTAFTACWLPARRAAKVDPMEALRCE